MSDVQNRTPVNKAEKYAAECIVFNRPQQTFSVFAYLYAAREGAEPALTMNAPFSRFDITLVDKSKPDSDVYVSSNIIAGVELASLLDNYETFKIQRAVSSIIGGDNKKDLSPAYTVVLKSGFMKGKTVAEILSEDASKKDELLRTRAWLSKTENLNKFPDNIKVIEAIDDGINKLVKGELDADYAKSQSNVIFERKYKQIKGYTVHSTICISYIESNSEYPWSFTITNDKILETVPKVVVEGKPKTINFLLNNDEMSGFINKLDVLYRAFVNYKYPDMQARVDAITEKFKKNKNIS